MIKIKIVLFDLDRSRCDEIAKLFKDDLEIEIADSLESCLKEADIVTTLTPARTPFLEYELLKDMVHINAVGADAKGKRELSQSVLDNIDYVPPYNKGTLYIRPIVWGTSPAIGVKPVEEYTFMVFVSPVGTYFKGG